MSSGSRQQFDVLVIGGGPAGIAAAVRAAECGQKVGLVDDNPQLGGQIWRHDSEKGIVAEAAVWFERLRNAGVAVLSGTRIFHQPAPGILLAEGMDELYELSFRSLILATGARERFLPFPGWTLPNVMGAGGLQALVKSGLPIRGKRVVVAGTGPLLLAAAAYLRKCGAEIPIIAEQASWSRLAYFGAALFRQPSKIAQAFQLKRELSGVRFAANCWPTAAHGKEKLGGVTLWRSGKIHAMQCDYLACGFHLVPNLELPVLLGCQIQQGLVKVDEFQETSVKSVFCAGEPTGIGGLDLSLVEGQIAGLAAAGRNGAAKELFGQCAKLKQFVRVLDRTFKLRPELRRLPQPETIVCRCEDVSYLRVRQSTSWRAAKLQTRCGMGPCQGRVCGPAAQFLFKWTADSVRPPIFPTRCENLAAAAVGARPEHEQVTGGH